jgi:hypothetical protein
MDGILIAGVESSLLASLVEEALKSGRTAFAMIPRNGASTKITAHSGSDKAQLLNWNPSSPISAHSLVLAAKNQLGTVNTALLVCAPPPSFESSDFSPAGIDFLVNNYIKSFFLLARELVQHFREQKNGTLVPLVLEEQNEKLLSAPLLSAFKAFSNGLLPLGGTDGLTVKAFSCPEKIPSLDAEFVRYIFKVLNEGKKNDGGKWYKFNKLTSALKL